MRQHFVRHVVTGQFFAVRTLDGSAIAAAGPVRHREVFVDLLEEILGDTDPELVARINAHPILFPAVRAPHL